MIRSQFEYDNVRAAFIFMVKLDPMIGSHIWITMNEYSQLMEEWDKINKPIEVEFKIKENNEKGKKG